MTTPHPRRRFFRYSLRTLFIVVTVFCVWMGITAKRARDRQHFIDRCEAREWVVHYEYEYDASRSRHIYFDQATKSVVHPKPFGPEILRRILGHGYFNEIREIHVKLHDEEDHKLFTQVALHPSITNLRISGRFQENDIAAVASLPRLEDLRIELAVLTSDEIRSMSRNLPECNIYIRIMDPD